MAQSLEKIESRLERITAQLEQAAKRNSGPGLTGAIKPFLLGALLGAGAALLYAPQAGEEARATLRRNAEDWQSRATEAANSAKERLPESLKGAQDDDQTLLAETKAQGTAALKKSADSAGAAQAGAPREKTDRSRADQAQAQLRRDLTDGSENPS